MMKAIAEFLTWLLFAMVLLFLVIALALGMETMLGKFG